MEDCQICCEKYNKSSRLNVCCNNAECDYHACRSCIQTYVMSSTSDPHCMNCRKTWDQDFIVLNLTRVFYEKTYKVQRKNLLFEREQSKIPDTMNDVAQYVKAKGKENELQEYQNEANNLYERITEIRRNETRIRNEIHLLKTGKSKEVERKKFIMPCPGDDCRGFLSTAYKCEVCSKFSCPKCLLVLGDKKDENHVCNEDSVKNADYIKSTTKPCPKCGERISKIDGCDQMWCTICNSAFSWNTGLIDKGSVIHNPHYYQYLRNNTNNGNTIPRNPGDNPCEMNPRMYSQFYRNVVLAIGNHLWKSFSSIEQYKKIQDETDRNNLMDKNFQLLFKYRNQVETISNLIRVFNHYHYEFDRNNADINLNSDYRTLRIQYIVKEITKEKMSEKMIAMDTKRKKFTEINNILQLIDTVGHDIIKSIFDKLMGNRLDVEFLKEQFTKISPYELLETIDNVYNELLKFVDYCNDKFAVIGVAHNMSVHYISKRTILSSTTFKGISSEFITTYPEKYAEIRNYKGDLIQHEPRKKKYTMKSIKKMESC